MSEENKKQETTKHEAPTEKKTRRKPRAKKQETPENKPEQKDGKIAVKFLKDKGNGFKKGMIKRLNKSHAEQLIKKGLAEKC